MPNHVTNRVVVTGPEADVQALVALVTTAVDEDNNRNPFDFNKIIPRPKTLDITCGTTTEVGLWLLGQPSSNQFSTLFDDNARWLKFAQQEAGLPETASKEDCLQALRDKKSKMIIEAEQFVENKRLYGHGDWYQWSVANWGTKWGSYDHKDWVLEKMKRGGKAKATVEFDTAWSPPEPVLKKLSEMFPTVEVRDYWKDEGGPSGRIFFKNGKEEQE